ncbi:YhgE/Pip domain-containing protein [Microbacterium sp. R86528]|uniref:YhgE/Pip domain-containing protein n=1 Tax=Microbacterium sp. R86528 TaxID=3093864 RepID=UPI0037CA2EC6
MKGILLQFRSDVRRATSSVMAVVVLCGLIAIPSVFTWFNVVGSWEPFDNTKNLKVAVASVDEGYTSPLIPIHLNVGSLVESALRENDQMDWIITTEEDAIAGTESGDYYAAMVLPKDFSERMLTFYRDGSEQTHIDYYTNDKSNPLAPLITSEGADDLSAKINSEFTKELSNIALSLVSSIVKNLDSADSQAAFLRVEAHLSDVATQLRAASGTATMFTGILEASIPLVEGGASLLQKVESEFSVATGKVQEGLGAAQDADAAITQATAVLAEAFATGSSRLGVFSSELDEVFSGRASDAAANIELIDDMISELDDLIAQQVELRDRLIEEIESPSPEEEPQAPADDDSAEEQSQAVDSDSADLRAALQLVVDSLNAAIEREQALQLSLGEAADGIAEGSSDMQEFHSDIDQRITAAQSSLDNASAVFENDLKPVLDELAATLGGLSAGLGGIAEDVAGLSTSTSGISGVIEDAAVLNSELATTMDETATELERVVGLLSSAIDTGDFAEVSKVIGSDPELLANALSDPVGVDRRPLYPIVSFGAGMAPLYSTLALWVGALLLSVTLRVDPPSRPFGSGEELKLHERFLGRYGLFAVLGLAQSTLVFLGNILIVGLQPAHPFLFILVGWVTSTVFTFIIYTLVVSFSDAGKALAVFLLVIQVAGAGGAYPLVLLPEWFQNVSPFLPATHAIDAFRAAMAGIYHADYWISLAWLLAFLLPMLLLGLVLRKPLIGVNEKMESMLHSTKLM